MRPNETRECGRSESAEVVRAWLQCRALRLLELRALDFEVSERDRSYLPLRRVREGNRRASDPRRVGRRSEGETSRELQDVKARSAEDEFGQETRG